MDTDKFWSMIDQARQQSARSWQEQHENFVVALCELPPDEIQQFDRILWATMLHAYRADLWGAAFVAACGCGDDSFNDFREWLIQQGQATYEKVLEDPENLVDFVDEKDRLSIYDGWIADTAWEAYQRQTGQNMPGYGYAEKPVLIGKLPADEEDIIAAYPRIVAKLGDCSDPDFI